MTATEESDNWLEHLRRHLGDTTGVEPGEQNTYDLYFFHEDNPSISTVITNGMRFQPITSMLPEEVACSLRGDQQHIARHLVNSTAGMMMRAGRGLDYGLIVENEDPIVNGTEIRGVLAYPSPYFGNEFDLFPTPHEPTTQIISLIPITAAEADFVRSEDHDELFERFRDSRANILDVRRASVV